jgi:hypothetical protein
VFIGTFFPVLVPCKKKNLAALSVTSEAIEELLTPSFSFSFTAKNVDDG